MIRRNLFVMILLGLRSRCSPAELRVTVISRGKIIRQGDCKQPDWNVVRGEIRKKAETERQALRCRSKKGKGDIQSGTHPSTNSSFNYGQVYDGCKTDISGGCFWTEFIERGATNLTRANETCTSHGSFLALIPDQETFEEILNNSRKKLLWDSAAFWLGMTYDYRTAQLKPNRTWNPVWSVRPERDADVRTISVCLRVREPKSSDKEGLETLKSGELIGGVVCWKPKTSPCSRRTP